MERVTGIGGIFFKVKNPEKLRTWYSEHLGIEIAEYGGSAFLWVEDDAPGQGMTIWSIFPDESNYFDPSPSSFMINYRVRDLDAMLSQLRGAGVQTIGDVEESEYGRFAWVLDPEGNKLELWQPPEKSAD